MRGTQKKTLKNMRDTEKKNITINGLLIKHHASFPHALSTYKRENNCVALNSRRHKLYPGSNNLGTP